MTGRRSHGRLSALNGVVHQGIGLLEMGVRGPQQVDPRTEHGGHARLADQAMTMWTWQ